MQCHSRVDKSQFLGSILAILICLLLASCSTLMEYFGTPDPFVQASPSITVAVTLTSTAPDLTCAPTYADDLSPSYKPNTPVRSVVGHGHILTGVVRSSRDCKPIPDAKLEFWPEYAGKGHPDSGRATLFTDRSGSYRFECDPPEHIHMRISADGYHTLASNAYHPDGKANGRFDIVLVPED